MATSTTKQTLDTRRAIERYAAVYGFDPELISAIVAQESGGDPNAKSAVGAKGTMQIFGNAPVADALRTGLLKSTPDMSTVDGQVEAGVAYLAYLRDHEKAPSLENLLLMYNGGPKMKGAAPNGTAADLAAYASSRTGKKFDGTQNAGYRDAIMRDYASRRPGADPQQALRFTGTEATANTQLQGAASANGTTGLGTAPVTSVAVGSGDTAAKQTATAVGSTGLQGSGANLNIAPNASAVARLETDFKTAENSMDAALKVQQNMAARFESDVQGLPQAPNYDQMLQSSLQELENFGSKTRQAVESGYAQLLEQDAQKRSMRGNLAERVDYNPVDPDSLLQGVLQDQVMLQKKLRATQAAALQMAKAPFGSAAFLERAIFGNRYISGAAELSTMSAQQTAMFNNTMSMLDKQATLAEAINFTDPALMKDKMNADLRLLEVDSEIARSKAELPMKFYEAQVRDTSSRLEMAKQSAQMQQGIADLNIKSAELGVRKTELLQDITNAPLKNEAARIQLESSKLALSSAKTEAEMDAAVRDSKAAYEQLRYRVGTAELTATSKELERKEALRRDPAYTGKLTEAELVKLDAEIANARAAVRAGAADEQLSGAKTAYEKLRLSVGTKELNVQATELARKEALLNDPAYMASLSEAESMKLKSEVVTLRNNIVQQETIAEAGANRTAVIAQQAQNNAIIGEATAAERSREQQKYAWNNVLGNSKPDGTDAEVPLGLSQEQKLALELMAQGQAAGKNPIEAIVTITDMGAFKGAPTIQKQIMAGTATSVMTAAKNKGISDLKAVAGLSKQEVLQTLGETVNPNKLHGSTNPAIGAREIGGVLPSSLLVLKAPDATTKAFFNNPQTAQAFDEAATWEDKITAASKYATETLGYKSLTDRANFISGVFISAVKANNEFRGYSEIGLPTQTGIRASFDTPGLFTGSIEVDLSSSPQVERLLAQRAAMRGQRFLNGLPSF